MIEIVETKRGNECVYEYRTIKDNKIVYSRKIDYRTVPIEDGGKIWFLLYNTNEEVVRAVFRFINIEKDTASFHSKELAAIALKLLFIFVDIFNIDFKKITLEDAKLLKSFMGGESKVYGNYKINLDTQRSSDTVNSYMGVYRAFYEYVGIYNSPFHMKALNSLKVNTHGNKVSDKLILNSKSNKNSTKVPMYIKPHEIEKIITVIRNEYTLRDEIIVRLMYECGMRIGEVLGLTLEDINTSPDEIDVSEEGCGELIIRNRLSDEPHQYAKGCMEPKSKRSYRSNAYNQDGIGYQKVNPSMDLLMSIEEYIEDMFSSFSDKRRENYCKFSVADKVTVGEFLEGDNYYIFINKNGTPLHKSGWNKTLREIFLKSGLKLDRSKRKHNLSHRFRHGYAMFLKKYKGFGTEDIMYALRHSKPETVAIYFRPDDDDIYKANTDAVLSMYEICPALIRGDS